LNRILILDGYYIETLRMIRLSNAAVLESYQLENCLKPKNFQGKRGKKGKAKKDWQK